MKKFRILPSIMMVILCISALCVGVFSVMAISINIVGELEIIPVKGPQTGVDVGNHAQAEVQIDVFANSTSEENRLCESVTTTSGGCISFNTSSLNFQKEIVAYPCEIKNSILIRIRNLSSLELGAYFYNGSTTAFESVTNSSGNTVSIVTVNGLAEQHEQLKDEFGEVWADVYKSSYSYIAKATTANEYDVIEMRIDIVLAKFVDETPSVEINFPLNIEEYVANNTTGKDNGKVFQRIASSVTIIEEEAFFETGTPTAVVIPTSVISIESYAFSECYNLKYITVPNSITSLGSFIFCYMNSLNYLFLPNSITDTTYRAGGDRLKYIVLPESTEILDNGVFNSSFFTSFVLPTNITKLGTTSSLAGTFSSSVYLETVVLSENLTSLSNGGFFNCSKLTNIAIKSPAVYTSATNSSSITSTMTTIKVLSSIIDSGKYTNTYLNSSTFTRSTTAVKGYYVFTRN